MIVTLIHGTFAREAAWVRPGSFLRTALQEQCGDQVEIDLFEWSGRNTIAGRSEAADRLIAKLRERAAGVQGERSVIIAHSHAGNIALYAMRDPSTRDRVAGVICLSTPFVHARRRWLDLSVLEWLIVVGLFAVLIGLHAGSTNKIETSVLGLAVGLMAVCLLMFWWASWHANSAFESACGKVLASLALPILPSDFPLLIIRTLRDEATIGLHVAGMAAVIVHWFYGLAETFANLFGPRGAGKMVFEGVDGADRLFARLWPDGRSENPWGSWIAFFGIMTTAGVGWALLSAHGGSGVSIGFRTGAAVLLLVPAAVTTAVIAPAMIFGLLMSLLSVVGVCCALALGIVARAFGSDLGLASIGLEIAVDSAPVGEWPLTQVGWAVADESPFVGRAPLDRLRRLLRFNHCEVYDHPEAVAAVIRFVKDRLN
jgi:hypothetical protein